VAPLAPLHQPQPLPLFPDNSLLGKMGAASSVGERLQGAMASVRRPSKGASASSARGGGDGFTSLADVDDRSPRNRSGMEGIHRLQGYAVPDREDGRRRPKAGASASLFASINHVMEGLQRDQQRAGTPAAVSSSSTSSGQTSMARTFSALPPLPDEVIGVVAALSFERFAVGNVRGQVLILDWVSGSLLAAWRAGKRQVTALCNHGDGVHILSGIGSGGIAMWDFKGNKACELVGHTQEVRSIEVLGSNAGRAVSGSRDCTVRVWDLERAECLHSSHVLRNVVTRLRSFPAEQAAIHGFAFVQASEDLRLRFWSVEASGRLALRHALHAGREQLVALDISEDGTIVTGSKGFERSSCELAVWDTRTMEKRYCRCAFDNTIEALRIVRRTARVAQLVAVSCDASMKCFTLPELELLWEENSATSAPYTAVDVALGNAGQVAVLTTTTAPEVFAWCWGTTAGVPRAATGASARPLAPLDYPPLLRARGEGSSEAVLPTPAMAPAEQGAVPNLPPIKPTPDQRPTTKHAPSLSSLSALLSKVKDDEAAFEAKQKVARLVAGPTRVPRRDRVKGVSPLAHANADSKEEDVQAIFREIDRDANGWIDSEELQEYLGDYLGYGEKEIAHFMQSAKSEASAATFGSADAGAARISFESFRKHFRLLNAVYISQRHDESFLRRPGSVGRQQFCLEECDGCQVLVCDIMDQIFVDQCRRCRVLLGPSSASAFVRDCTDCTFWVATQQLRTRNCHRCKFHLFSQTEPVIEQSTALSFAPWTASYPLCGLHFQQAGFDSSRNFWNAIFDFTPHPQGRCNWCIIPLNECECITVTFDELSEDKQSIIPPDCPTANLSHELLCMPPLQSGEHSGHSMGDLPQVRPRMPPVPPAGSMPKLSVERDAVDEPAPRTSPDPATKKDEALRAGRSADACEDAAHAVAAPDRDEAAAAPAPEVGRAAAPALTAQVPAAPVAPPTPPAPRPAGRPGRRLMVGSDAQGAQRERPTLPAHAQDHKGVAKASLSSLRQKYTALDAGEDGPGDWKPTALSARLNEITTLQEEEEDEEEAAQKRQAEVHEREAAEQSELERMWDYAHAANLEAAARPSPWRIAAAEPAITYAEAWHELAGSSPARVSVPELVVGSGLDGSSAAERDALVAVARTKLCEEDVTHLRVLQTVWRRLAGTDAPLRVGSHWQRIGFQGDDPATDLRGVGLLGLLHLLALAERAPAALNAGLAASQHAVRHFPFAVSSINFTKMIMDILLEGKLDAACKRAGGAEGPVVALYLGAFRRFLRRWEQERLAVEDFGRALKEISKTASKSPQLLITEGLEGTVDCAGGPTTDVTN